MSVQPLHPPQTEPEWILRGLAAEQVELGVTKPRAIAQALLLKQPDLFFRMSAAERESVLAKYLSFLEGRNRHHAVRGERLTVIGDGGAREAVIRISTTGKSFWSALWTLGEKRKETRDLTTKDLEWLIRHYYGEALEMKARALWLTECLKTARKYHAKTLGDLEAKGIDLPTLDVPDDTE